MNNKVPNPEELLPFIEKYGEENITVGPRVISMTTLEPAHPILWKRIDDGKLFKVGEIKAYGRLCDYMLEMTEDEIMCFDHAGERCDE